MIDPVNPYRAPEAAIVGRGNMFPRPPVYTAISIFSWVAGVTGFLLSIGSVFLLGQLTVRFGWRRVFLTGVGLKVVLIAALVILATTAYIAAGQFLWVRRGRPGLILCGTAIGMTYVAAWLYTWR